MDKNRLIDINDRIAEQDGFLNETFKSILSLEIDLNEMEKEKELVVENQKAIIWADSSLKNNDQRNAVLNKTLLDDEEYINLDDTIDNMKNNIKQLKIDIEKIKAEKNYWKRMFEIEMLFAKSNDINLDS